MKKFSEITTGVFASGKGTRIRAITKNKLPKSMVLLAGKPLLYYTVKTLNDLGFDRPNLLVGYKKEIIKKYFKNKCNYIVQKKYLGTGNAAKIILQNIENKYKYLLIFQGDDSAFYKKETINKFMSDFLTKKPVISFMVTKSDDETIGRVATDKYGKIIKVIEKENITPEDLKKYKLVNTAGYLFDIAWMRKNILKLKKHFPKGEYYLPDLIKMAIVQKKEVIGYEIPTLEWYGINTPEQLQKANDLKNRKK